MTHRNIYAVLLGFILTAAIFIINNDYANTDRSTATIQDQQKVFQLRTYTTHDGKLDDLHQRFENYTMDFFEKHGMKNIAYWTPTDPELKDNTLIYIVSHESMEAAEKSWENFVNDPEWQKVDEASRADGPIVENIESVYMTTTPYSPMK